MAVTKILSMLVPLPAQRIKTLLGCTEKRLDQRKGQNCCPFFSTKDRKGVIFQTLKTQRAVPGFDLQRPLPRRLVVRRPMHHVAHVHRRRGPLGAP